MEFSPDGRICQPYEEVRQFFVERFSAYGDYAPSPNPRVIWLGQKATGIVLHPCICGKPGFFLVQGEAYQSDGSSWGSKLIPVFCECQGYWVE